MTAFLSDQDVAARVLGHIEGGTTDRGDAVWREPVANYRSPERLEAEIGVLRRSANAFCPSAALPEPGSYFAREAAGVPLLAVRGRDRRVRVFRNACRHRGTPLAEGSGCAKALVCPYHAWAYKLDGTLQHVPHESGFPGLDREKHGLVPVASQERLGIVFATPDEPLLEDPLEGLPEMMAPEQQLLASNHGELDVNWKVYLEGFLEGYHIRPTHPESFYPYGFDNLNVVEQHGPHTRITYPFRRIQKLAEVPPAERKVEGRLTYVYHLFPNALVTILSRHTNLVILEPIGLERTRVFNFSLTNRGEGGEAGDAADAQRDAAFVSQTGLMEDLAIVLSIQRSIASGANEFFTFGQFEANIVHFHRTLTAALAHPGVPT